MKKIIMLALLLLPTVAWAEAPTVVINEIAWMGTQNSSNDEWLDLYNATENDIDLAGWKLEAADGTPSIELSGLIPAHGYFLLERTDDDTVPQITADQIYSGSLSNSGEWLKLLDQNGKIIDQLKASDGWPGGDNVTKQTLVRVDNSNWQTNETVGGAPKNSGVINQTTKAVPTTAAADDNEQAITVAKRDDILITEVYPNPPGPDNANEFIELKNVSNADIDLTGWTITNATKQSFILPSLIMSPQSIVVYLRQQTNLAFNNQKDTITLAAKNNKIINQISYNHLAQEDESYQINGDDYQWVKPSPNKILELPPTIWPLAIAYGPTVAKVGEIIMFDGSDSFDPQHRALTLNWEFGDGQSRDGEMVRHLFLSAGKFKIKLSATVDQGLTSSTTLSINIVDPNQQLATTTATSTPETIEKNNFTISPKAKPDIMLAEYLPDPVGSDTDHEFIELYNNEPKPIDLSGWQLDDDVNGSKPFTILDNTIIEPNSYLVFTRPQTKIALNNDSDSVRLFSPNGDIIDESTYDSSKEGSSYIKDENGDWQLTDTPTPGEINAINVGLPENTTTAATGSGKILGTEITDSVAPPHNAINKYLLSGGLAVAAVLFGLAIKYKHLA
ncbi:MAG: lamin tail domain-containing protein [Patescibacteria group bacterium]|nr:lamin tail domain-containing protein [Patescibacteria group bacterium]